MRITNLYSKKRSIIFLLLMLFTSLLSAQDENTYSIARLITMAKEMPASKLCTLLAEDYDNVYYSVNTSEDESRFVKIRIIEQSYESDFLINIGMSSKDLEHIIYIVKKIPPVKQADVYKAFEVFRKNAELELTKLNDEQLRLWYLQHDKYHESN